MKVNCKSLIVTMLAITLELASGGEVSFQNGVDGYEGARDASLHGEPAAISVNNFGGAEILPVEGVPYEGIKRMSILRFDDIVGAGKNQIPPGSKVNSATLELYRVGSPEDVGQYDQEPNAAKAIHVYPMLVSCELGDGMGSAPVEGAVCFAQRAFSAESPVYWGKRRQLENGPVADVDYDKSKVAAAYYRAGEDGIWMSWNITEIAAQWVADPASNNGLFLVALGSWIGVQFASSEGGSSELRPRLVVEFTPPVAR